MSAAPHQRYKLTLAYRGTRYHGWQSQAVTENYTGPAPAAGEGIPTIQETLARAIESVVRHPVRPVGSSRTDAGVHAKGQIVHFDTAATQIPREGLRRAVNAALPTDITIRKLEPVGEEFDAITSTTSKRYQYAIWNQSDRPTFFADLVWHRWQPLDVDAMRAAAAKLIGTHDFASFARPGHGRENTIRTVLSCDVARRGPMIVIGIEGTGFLWNMVRIIIGTLAEVGMGRVAPGEMEAILAARDRQAAGPTAPPHGLYLQWIRTATASRDAAPAPAPAQSPETPPRETAEPKLIIRSHHGQYAKQICAIAGGLGEWFRDKALHAIAIDARHQKGLIAFAGSAPVGFLLFNVRAAVGQITWMGVVRDHHRRGIGRKLLERLAGDLRAAGVREVAVETLGPSTARQPYECTRAFYAATGFVELRRIPQPANPECPELLVLRRQI